MSADAKRKAAFVTHEGLYQLRVMPFGLCNARQHLRDLWTMCCVECGGRCVLVYLDDVISFGVTVSEALFRLEEVLNQFGLQPKAKKCTFMQTEVGFLGHIVGRTGLACEPGKVSAVCAWHAPGSVKQVGFIGYNPSSFRILRWEGFSIRSRMIGRSSLLTLAGAFVSLSDSIVLLDGRCSRG